jgi:predicted nucleic acid-binding protein
MKTTLNIDDTVMERLRREAARRGSAMSELVEAAMREHGISVIYTRDSDFHRFPSLEVRDPFARQRQVAGQRQGADVSRAATS